MGGFGRSSTFPSPAGDFESHMNQVDGNFSNFGMGQNRCSSVGGGGVSQSTSTSTSCVNGRRVTKRVESTVDSRGLNL